MPSKSCRKVSFTARFPSVSPRKTEFCLRRHAGQRLPTGRRETDLLTRQPPSGLSTSVFQVVRRFVRARLRQKQEVLLGNSCRDGTTVHRYIQIDGERYCVPAAESVKARGAEKDGPRRRTYSRANAPGR